jgi:hypothetical protein
LPDRLSRRRRRGGLRDGPHEIRDRRDFGKADIDRAERLAGGQEVVVRVDEAWDDRSALDVDGLCGRNHPPDFAVRADGEDAGGIEGNGVDPRPPAVGREHASTVKDHGVGSRRGRHLSDSDPGRRSPTLRASWRDRAALRLGR